MKYTAYAGVRNAAGESAGSFMPADSLEDGWEKIVEHFRACQRRRGNWTGGMEAIYLNPYYEWHVRPAVFQ